MNVMELISVLAPEVWLSAMLVILLLVKIFGSGSGKVNLLFIISFFFLAATASTLVTSPQGALFGGM